MYEFKLFVDNKLNKYLNSRLVKTVISINEKISSILFINNTNFDVISKLNNEFKL